ncbi:transcription-associated protein 1, partial [Coemansia guatemalensis]
GHNHAAHGTPDHALERGQQLIALISHPLAQKRLANISSPTTQGCQLFEQVIGSSASIGDTCAASRCLDSGEAAIAAVAASTAQSTLSLDELQAGGRPSITRAGLTSVIWALSLAASCSEPASELLKAIIAQGARQHVIQCVQVIRPEAQAGEHAAPCAAVLAAVVPEIISRMLSAQSEGLRATKRLMLRHFHSALCDLLPNNAALVGHLPAMRRIVSDLCAACYDPDTSVKRGGCMGIAFVVQELDLGHAWLTENLLELSKGLLFTLKDINANAVQHVPPADSRATLLEIIKLAFPPSIFALSDADDPVAMDVDGNGDEDGASKLGLAHDAGGD